MTFLKVFFHKFLFLTLTPIYSFLATFVLLFKKKRSGIFHYLTLYFSKLMFVKNIRIHYDPEILTGKRTLLISNHVNNLDWFIMFSTLQILKRKNIFFYTKKSLRLFCKFFSRFDKNINFIFLERNLDQDYITLIDSVKTINNQEEFISVLFPEGTLKHSKKSKYINKARARRRKVKCPDNVILPKTKGFEILSKFTDYDSIINCTIIYNEKFNLKNFILANKLSVDVYLSPTVMDKDPEEWLLDLFYEKDRLITERNLQRENYLTINRPLNLIKTFNFFHSFNNEVHN